MRDTITPPPSGEPSMHLDNMMEKIVHTSKSVPTDSASMKPLTMIADSEIDDGSKKGVNLSVCSGHNDLDDSFEVSVAA